MDEIRVDTREYDAASAADGKRSAELCFKLNHTMPMTEEYQAVVAGNPARQIRTLDREKFKQ